jgi:hypothetical protein
VKKSIRKLHVDGEDYLWVLAGNTIDGVRESHIAVFLDTRRQRLLLDPYSWHFEIRPRTIADAIRFALEEGWKPEESGPPLYLGYCEQGFFFLPEGIEFARQLPEDERQRLEQKARHC